jgi:hypothetical protein
LITLSYAIRCSKLRVGEFGGGALFVTADDVQSESTDTFLERVEAAFHVAKHPEAAMAQKAVAAAVQTGESA